MKYSIFIVTTLLLLASCKKENPELEAPGSKLEGINANWQMVEVIQVDEASISKEELDVSEAFINAIPLQINFNSSDFTYSVVNTSGPNYFGDGGSWEFDDNEYPTKITLNTTANKTITLPLVRTIRPQDTYLNVSLLRNCGTEESPYIGYKFKFIRTN
jgi:hypothetical protein